MDEFITTGGTELSGLVFRYLFLKVLHTRLLYRFLSLVLLLLAICHVAYCLCPSFFPFIPTLFVVCALLLEIIFEVSGSYSRSLEPRLLFMVVCCG